MKALLMTSLVTTSLFSGCAVFQLEERKFAEVDQMQVAPVNVNLVEKNVNPIFYNKNEMQSYMTQCITERLKERGKYSADAKAILNTGVNYRRMYSGQIFGKNEAIEKPLFGYYYKIKEGSEVLQEFEELDLQPVTDLADNARSMFMLSSGNVEKSSENIYLDALCQRIAYRIR